LKTLAYLINLEHTNIHPTAVHMGLALVVSRDVLLKRDQLWGEKHNGVVLGPDGHHPCPLNCRNLI